MKSQVKLKSLVERYNNDVKNGAAPNYKQLKVRDLLSWFGHERRGKHIANQVNRELKKQGLHTVPNFDSKQIDLDTIVSIELAPRSGKTIEPSETQDDPTVRIGVLESAKRKPISVSPNDLIVKAATLMQMNDYSQLPVMTSERDVKGIINWESICIGLTTNNDQDEVRFYMDTDVREVNVRTPLYDAIGGISEYGYVLVRGEDNKITGIVTPSDLAPQFMQHAGPYLYVGEIEIHLRSLVHGKFTVDEMREASQSEGGRPIQGTEDLTLGGYCRLLESPERWGKLNLEVDRGIFMRKLNQVREIRNDVMHFDPK